jgi:hypothetical protein
MPKALVQMMQDIMGSVRPVNLPRSSSSSQFELPGTDAPVVDVGKPRPICHGERRRERMGLTAGPCQGKGISSEEESRMFCACLLRGPWLK